ncbi:HAE1 family hydrophobic/amphiphilic exporter-1 [Prosthecobacter fusiformis]|uniref:HAE1 family hydrophobic/amphiphilic exporter-1 n=1 Tax=Prosthecobacter fusiformis TaxID=48464 RepID=A0A4R7RNG1_9BACT|nr:efflux RND transporter permease subunit [Prosthecobacter fusiformis]TDU64574.1 HAE1 family hydrophobic/amphiphilic exporter-1 [Prosthecobacter fusiformis]
MTPERCIHRPVMTTLIMAGILAFGMLAFQKLPVNDLPNVDFPTLSVTATLPGANPETMAASVATPLEKQFSTIAGIDSMSSTSALGNTNITIQFNLDRDIDGAALDVQSAISAAQRNLPDDMPSPPSFRKVNPADFPVLIMQLSSDTLPISTVDEYAQTALGQRISMVEGVAQVRVFGSQKYAVRVQADPLKLASLGISLDEVRDAIAAGNSNLPAGVLQGTEQNFTLQTSGKLVTAEAFRPLIVAYREGAPVRLEQVAKVLDSVEDNQISNYATDGKRSILLAVQRQPGANTVQVVDAVKALLPSVNAQMPAAMELSVLIDRSHAIRESVHDVQLTLILTIGLVIVVIFMFLRNFRATIIPSIAIPLSIVGTFAVMHLLGFSMNNISLMALTLSVGFIVDDAIVVLENIVRHIEKGESVWDAALKGSREITFTVISMTLSLAAVFLPVLFMGGIMGRLLNEFAVTIGVAILVSGFVSLTLTPMLCSRFLKPHVEKEHHGWFYSTTERFFDGLLHIYDITLKFSLRHRFSMMLVTLGTVAGTAWLFVHLPKGFIPTEDTGQIQVMTEGAQDASFETMERHQKAVAEVLARNPHVQAFSSSVGASGPSSTGNSGRMFVSLKPRSERPTAQEVVNQLRPQLAAIPGIRAFPQVPTSIRIGGRSSKSPYQYTLSGVDLKQLFEVAPKIEAALVALPELADVTSDLLITSPQVYVEVNRNKASSLGLTATEIENALYNAYGSRQVSSIYTPTNQYYVILEVDPNYRADMESLGLLYIRGANSELVPLSSVADITRTVGPLTVTHSGQLPSVTISFATKPGVSIGQAVSAINQAVGKDLPAGISTAFQGEAEAFQSSLQGLGMLLVMAVVVIYLVLGILYESFIHPLTILSGLPSAGVGALLTLWVFGYELNLYGFVGVLMLIGIVKKNAIMMIDFALEAERNEGKKPADAIYEACLVRFRPIMMTTFAAIMGALPIALGLGAGAEARRPLGLAVVGGLLLSQMLTLYITPVFYIYMEKMSVYFQRKKKEPVADAGTATAVAA